MSNDSPEFYIQRKLVRYANRKIEEIEEKELSQRSCPIIILGEPGMGKSSLLKQLSKLFPTGEYVGAPLFSIRPDKYASSDPVIIDGLDEVSARKDGDALDNVLSALKDAGDPPFILSCRERDWEKVGRINDIASIYGHSPEVWTLLPLTRDEAKAYLNSTAGSEVDGEKLLNAYDSHNLSELYQNPQTLKMLSDVARKFGGEPPKNRADLYEKSVSVLWCETNEAHKGQEHARLGENEALGAAGAIFASLLMTGNQTIKFDGTQKSSHGQLFIGDILSLPQTVSAEAVCNSRLFKSSDMAGAFAPIHRTIAEYLGARWLTKQIAENKKKAKRVIGTLTVEGDFPVSIAGLCAWMARSAVCFDVISKISPMRILAEGDSNGLNASQQLTLLEDLESHSVYDPFFLVGYRHLSFTMALKDDDQILEWFKRILSNKKSSTHLKATAINILKDNPQAVQALNPELMAVWKSKKEYNFVRELAVDALYDCDIENIDWEKSTIALLARKDHASNNLAMHIVKKGLDGTFSANLIADCVLAHSAILIEESDEDEQRHVIGEHWSVVKDLNIDLLPDVLDRIASKVQKRRSQQKYGYGYHPKSEIKRFILIGIERLLAHDGVTAQSLHNWMQAIRGWGQHGDDAREKIASFLRENDEVRREMQFLAMKRNIDCGRGHNVFYESYEVNPGLDATLEDAYLALSSFEGKSFASPAEKDAFIGIVSHIRQRKGLSAKVKAKIMAIAGEDSYFEDMLLYAKSRRNRVHRARMARHEIKKIRRKKQENNKKGGVRKKILDHEEELRSGVFSWVHHLAHGYLNLYQDLNSDCGPLERLADWVGEDLKNTALEGFEAFLTTGNLMSSDEILDGFRRGVRYTLDYPLLCGLFERHRTGRGFEDLPDDVIRMGWYIAEDTAISSHANIEPIADLLRDELLSRTNNAQQELSRYSELALGNSNSRFGLYDYMTSDQLKPWATSQALEWLDNDKTMSAENVTLLVRRLLHCEPTAQEQVNDDLLRIANSRLNSPDLEDEERALWQAVHIICHPTNELPPLGSQQTPEGAVLQKIQSLREIKPFQDTALMPISSKMLALLIQEFRALHPCIEGVGIPDNSRHHSNPVGIIKGYITELAERLDTESHDLLSSLDQFDDGYRDYIRNGLKKQKAGRVEQGFKPATIDEIMWALDDQVPTTISQLQTVFLEGLEILQAQIKGNDTDTINIFYYDDVTGKKKVTSKRGKTSKKKVILKKGGPRLENDCRDRVADLLKLPYGILMGPEVAMPNKRRADLGVRLGGLSLPVEAKGQFHEDVWNAATLQLEHRYTIDHHARGYGVYLVFWFGHDVEDNRKVYTRGRGNKAPQSAEEMKEMLEADIPATSKEKIKVFVLDLSR